ncbi:hypothetical protein ALP77_102059 [Pseudomonas amygdali pv. tabaci]|nr:hypothetical protein ALP77_102059 [Pseudomonas amygdali pv. tabaci]
MNRVVGVFDVALGLYERVLDLRQFFCRQGCGVLPGLADHAVVAEAAREFALGAVDLAMQVVALHVADQLAYNKRHVAQARPDTAS